MQQTNGLAKHLAMAAFCLGLAALGVGLMVGTDYESSGGVVAALLGGFFVVTALVIYGSLLVRTLGARPAPRITFVDDEAALLLPRWRIAFVANCLLAGALALFFGGWGAVVGQEHGWAAGIVMGLPGLVFLMLPVFALTGRWAAGGLWLTPTRLVHHAYGVRGWTTWDDIAKVDPAPVDTSIQRTPVTGVHTRDPHGEYTTPFFRNGKLDGGGRLTLDLRDLPVAPAEIVHLVSTYWENPQLRQELGQQAAVDRVTATARPART